MECKHCKSQNGRKITSYKFHNVFECYDCKCWTKKIIETCCRNPLEVFVFKYGDFKAEKIHTQCMNCYGCLNMTNPLPFKQYAGKVRRESIFQIEEFEFWKVARNQEGKEIFEVEKYLKHITSNFFFYRNHLQSEYWKRIRLEVLERDRRLCQYCNMAEATEVHHLTYKNLGKEFLHELISYCRACHKKVHGK
jgi:hypothetical protein